MNAIADMFPEVGTDPDGVPDERYTLRETLAWCAEKAGVSAFDLDVAACEESHVAPEWFGAEQNGLLQSWHGRVWCNPPYSNIGPWVAKAWMEYSDGNTRQIAMLLPANRTEQPWWQKHVEQQRESGLGLTTHFLPGRVRFGMPGNPEGIGVGSPPFGCVLLVWRQP